MQIAGTAKCKRNIQNIMEVNKIRAIQNKEAISNRRREHEKFIVDGTFIE
ncbi:MAG: hypothetical protein ABS944_00675 [Solibacillus sp.]|jgi:hypothetical protein